MIIACVYLPDGGEPVVGIGLRGHQVGGVHCHLLRTREVAQESQETN
jgi:hypothetical protein